MLKFFLLILNDTMNNNGIMEKRKDFPSEILSQFNFLIGIFTLKPKLSEFYSWSMDSVNLFCLCRTRRQHIRMWRHLQIENSEQFNFKTAGGTREQAYIALPTYTYAHTLFFNCIDANMVIIIIWYTILCT